MIWALVQVSFEILYFPFYMNVIIFLDMTLLSFVRLTCTKSRPPLGHPPSRPEMTGVTAESTWTR